MIAEMSSKSLYELLEEALQSNQPVVLATIIARQGSSSAPQLGDKLLILKDFQGVPSVYGTLGNEDLDRIVARDALGELEAARSSIRHYGLHGEQREEAVEIFIESFAPPPKMIIFGAVDFTAALVRAAKLLGYFVVVSDARSVFATPVRFPQADEILVAWPEEVFARLGSQLTSNDAVCILTHDPKFDVPAITCSLETQVGYIGAMGSRRTHAKRVELLKEKGVTEQQLEKIMAPIGLDIGSRTPEETAISILAEIIALRTQTPALSLRNTQGPIHR